MFVSGRIQGNLKPLDQKKKKIQSNLLRIISWLPRVWSGKEREENGGGDEDENKKKVINTTGKY